MNRSRASKGLIMINTGDGKGKTTAALGTMLRMLGHGGRCGVIQFIKVRTDTGEWAIAHKLEGVEFHTMGHGFVFDNHDKSEDKKAAQAAWAKSKEMLSRTDLDLVVLDEITYPINFGFISADEVCAALLARPVTQNVILTGRNAPLELTQVADLISEIKKIKHPFDNGIKAQAGIDF